MCIFKAQAMDFLLSHFIGHLVKRSRFPLQIVGDFFKNLVALETLQFSKIIVQRKEARQLKL